VPQAKRPDSPWYTVCWTASKTPVGTRRKEGAADYDASPFRSDRQGRSTVYWTSFAHSGSCHYTDEKVVAVLHDVLEDTDVTLADLREEGASEKQSTAL